MDRLTVFITTSCLVLGFQFIAGNQAQAQGIDAELGELPPMPNLNLGYPDEKLTWSQKRRVNRLANHQRRTQELEARRAANEARPPLTERISKAVEKSPAVAKRPTKIDVQNSLTSEENARTPSGGRLSPFGDNNYWAGMPDFQMEEHLVDLPPLPDLRTPDQVTKKERDRDRKVSRHLARKAQLDAEREEKAAIKRATVSRPAANPDDALIQVESRKTFAAGFFGNQEAPETVNRETLRPFDAGSTYYRGNQLVYRGEGNERSRAPRFKRNREPR